MTRSRTAFAIGLLSCAAAVAAAPAYTVVDLGSGKSAYAINARGDVLSSTIYGSHPLVWRDGTRHYLDVIRFSHELYAINEGDVAVGVEYDADFVSHAVIWNRRGKIFDLSHLLPGNSRSEATGVAADGTVFGWYQRAGEEFHPFVVQEGMLTILDCPDYSTGCTARGASANGFVAGTLDMPFKRPAATWHRGTWRNIGTLGGSQAYADAVNDLGHAVGWSTLAGDQVTTAFLHADHGMVDLGRMGGVDSYALAINNDDTVVGYVGVDNGHYERHAVVWQGGESWRLDDVVVDRPDGWSFMTAAGINDMGWIVGTALENGTRYHAFLLKPIGR